MSTFDRVCFFAFLTSFTGVWLALQAFLWLGAIGVFLAHHAYVPLDHLWSALPDLLVQTLPLSTSFALLLGTIAAFDRTQRRQAFLWWELSGAVPALRMWPIVATGLTLSAGLAWYQGNVLPHAHYRLRFVTPTSSDTPTSLALRLMEEPGFLRGLRASVRDVAGGTMSDLTLVTCPPRQPFVLTAEHARVRLVDDAHSLELRLDHGRLLGLDGAGGLERNLLFDALDLRMDVPSLVRGSKRRLLSLKYYTNEELARIPDLYRHLRRKGWRLGEREARRATAAASLKTVRLQGALLPLLLLMGCVTYLGRHIPSRRWIYVAGVIGAGLLLLLQQSLVEVRTYKHGTLTPTWVALLPTVEVLTLCALGFALPSLQRWFRRAD